jgi:glucan biosynthesis protein C
MKTTVSNIGSAPIAVNAPARETGRLLFVDNMRVFLTILVIAHHLMVIYADSGGWIYHEGREDEITSALGGWFCAINQAYFMGLFLFVAAYFVPGAYDRKGPGRFLTDRLVRLGIPLATYGWVLRPLFIYFGMHPDLDGSFWRWYTGVYFQVYGLIGGGPLWFIEALLLFSLAYVLWRLLTLSRLEHPLTDNRFPANRVIALFALLLGVASFLVRLVFPVNGTFAPLNLQFANFSQYTALFVLGVVAYRRKWLTTIPDSAGRLWLGIAVLLILLYGPLAVLGGATENVDPFFGGWHWQSLAFAMWDSFVCISMCIGLISLFRRRLNHQGAIAHELSRSAYATYLIHEPVITFLAFFTAGVTVYPLLKFLLATVVFTPVCFGLGSLVRRLPSLDRVL